MITDPTQPAIACSLTSEDEIADRVRDWQEVLAGATDRQPIDGGLRLRFAPGPELAVDLARLAALEVGCCGWLAFSVVVSAETTTLEVRAPHAGMDLVTSMFGVP